MERIIIMARNEVGVIADVTRALADSEINIITINTESESEGQAACVIVTTEDNDRALDALTNAGFKAVMDDALVIRLRDEPGALAKVAERFKNADVNIQSLHILDRHKGYTMVALSADDREKAEALLDGVAMV